MMFANSTLPPKKTQTPNNKSPRNCGKDSWHNSTLYGEFPALQFGRPVSLVPTMGLRNFQWRLLML